MIWRAEGMGGGGACMGCHVSPPPSKKSCMKPCLLYSRKCFHAQKCCMKSLQNKIWIFELASAKLITLHCMHSRDKAKPSRLSVCLLACRSGSCKQISSHIILNTTQWTWNVYVPAKAVLIAVITFQLLPIIVSQLQPFRNHMWHHHQVHSSSILGYSKVFHEYSLVDHLFSVELVLSMQLPRLLELWTWSRTVRHSNTTISH